MLFSKGKSLVAIDIGGYSVKAVHLRKKGKGYELLNAGMIRLPADTVVDGEIENPEAVVTALKNLLKAEGISDRNAVMGVSGQSVVIKKISVPFMSRDELSEMIRDEAEQYLPFDIDEVNLDFQILSDQQGRSQGDDNRMDVLIVAARKEMVNVYRSVAEEAGLKLRVLDLDVFAIENAYEFTYGPSYGESVALVNIGGSMTNINILENGVTAFTRDLQSGGSNISEEIQKNLSIGYAEAEKLKLGIFEGDHRKEEVVPHILNGLDHVCTEISNIFDVFHKTSDHRISKIYLSGGTCRMENLDRLMEKNLGVRCIFMRAFDKISYDDKNIDPQYLREMDPVMALPVGLAMRTLGRQ